LLVADDAGDMAGSATPVVGPAFPREVPPLGGEGSVLGADGAPLPPLAVDELAAGVESLVGNGIDGDEVLDSVVLLVAVDVVDLVSWWDGSEVLLPNNVMGEPLPSADVAAEIALARDVETVCASWLRSGLSHPSGFTVLQLQYNSAKLSLMVGSRSRLSLFGMMKKRE
jgi:hypothetical protein